MYEKLKVLNM